MNLRYSKRKFTFFSLMVLVFISVMLSGCSKEKKTDTKVTDVTETPKDATGDKDVSSTNEDVSEKDDTTPAVPQNVIEFTTSENFKSYMSVKINMPAGVSLADVTYIGFNVDTKSDLSLRLYAGDINFTKADNNELTYEEKKLEETVVGTEDVTEDGVTVKKTKHNLTETILKSTRYALTAGDNQKVELTLDDHAKTVLSKVPGRVLNLGIYAHNIAPSFTVHSLQIKTATDTYDIQIAKKNISAFEGGTFTLKEAE